ncbi:hypothetical protein PCANB_001031 [Pneumocystis canis]|nr:hypothetical protein PCK1_001012 [Pneumocystis canis]KAG5437239.1 hypothetical protein PCANB_001031 [Pneumocystis canis]
MDKKHTIILSTTNYVGIIDFFGFKNGLFHDFFDPKIRLKITASLIHSVSHSLNGRFIAIAADSIYLCDLESEEKIICIPGTENAKYLVFGHKSDEIFFTKETSSLIMNYHIKTKKIDILPIQKEHPSPITFITISNDSRFILTSSENPLTIFVQDCMNQITNQIISKTASKNLKSAVFHPKKPDIFLLCFSNQTLEFYDAKNPAQAIFKIKDARIVCASFFQNKSSCAITIDLDGQLSIVDFEKKTVQMKWSTNIPCDFLSIKELDDGEWNVFISTYHGKCFYFNHEGIKLSEYLFDSGSILQISTLENDIPITNGFLNITIESSNPSTFKLLFSEDMQECFPNKKIQYFGNNKIFNTFLSKNDTPQIKIDEAQSKIEKKLHIDESDMYSQSKLFTFNTKPTENNLSIVSIGKGIFFHLLIFLTFEENIPLEDSTKNKRITNTPIRKLSTLTFTNKNDIFSSDEIYNLHPTFKFETPRISKKTSKLSIKHSNKQKVYMSKTTSEKSEKKHLIKSDVSPAVSDIWFKLGTNQNIDNESPISDCFSLKKKKQSLEIKDALKRTCDVPQDSPKSQDYTHFLLNKEFSKLDLKKDFSNDNILKFGDMLLEFQKGIRQDIQDLHIELIKQFMLQKIEFEKILRFKNKEIKNLKKENKKLVYELNVYRGYQ